MQCYRNEIRRLLCLFVFFWQIFNVLPNSSALASALHQRIEGANYEQLHQFVDEITGKNLLNYLRTRSEASGVLGPYMSTVIADVDNEYLNELTTLFRHYYFPYFKEIAKVPSPEAIPTKIIAKASTFAGTFATSITPDSLGKAGKTINATFILWMYFYDDEITKLCKRAISDKAVATEEVQQIVDLINASMLAAWKQGLAGEQLSSWTCNQTNAALRNDPSIQAAAALAVPLYHTARMIRNECPQLTLIATETSSLSKELQHYLDSLLIQTVAAPATPEEYLKQHKDSGGVAACFSINILLSVWKANATLTDGISKADAELIAGLMDAGNIVVLKINDAMRGKDIGQPEELYYATMLGKAAREATALTGASLPVLSDPQGHGDIIALLGGEAVGFATMQQLSQEIAMDFARLVAVMQQYEEKADNKRLAAIYNKAILRWVIGYQFVNPVSSRYGQSFNLYLAALNDDQQEYVRIFAQLRAASSFVTFSH